MKTAPVERKEGDYKAPVTLKGVLRHALCNANRSFVIKKLLGAVYVSRETLRGYTKPRETI